MARSLVVRSHDTIFHDLTHEIYITLILALFNLMRPSLNVEVESLMCQTKYLFGYTQMKQIRRLIQTSNLIYSHDIRWSKMLTSENTL